MSNRPSIIKTLSKVIASSLLNSPAGVVSSAIDFIFDRLGANEPSLKEKTGKLVEGIADTIGSIPEMITMNEKIDAILVNMQDLFEHCGLSCSDLMYCRLDPQRATKAFLDRGEKFLKDFDGDEKAFCERLVMEVYSHIITSADFLVDLESAFRRVVLEKLSKLDTLPADVARAVRDQAGAAVLTIPLQRWRSDLHPPSALLRAEYSVVPLHSRDQLLNDLIQWCQGEPSLSVYLLTGSGGMGKTRLLMELCRRCSAKGWRSGFLSKEAARLPESAIDSVLQCKKPVLIVMDYAETRQDQVLTVIRRAIPAASCNRIRIILASRSSGEWWDNLKRCGDAGDVLRGHCTGLHTLSPLAVSINERNGTFALALEAFLKARNCSIQDQVIPKLEGNHFNAVLFIHIAALAASEGEQINDASELLDYIVDRECRFWDEGINAMGLPGELKGRAVSQAAIFVTLCGEINSESEAEKILGQVPLLSDQTKALRSKIAELLQRLYPSQVRISGVTPDIIGEHLVAQELKKGLELPDIIMEMDDTYIRNTLTILTRLAQRDRVGEEFLRDLLENHYKRAAHIALKVALETGEPLGKILTEVLKKHPDPELAFGIEKDIPGQTLIMRELALHITEICCNDMQQRTNSETEAIRKDLACLLNNLAKRLSDMGKPEKAIDAIKKAVEMFRSLEQSYPNTYNPYIAASLSTMARMLSNMKKPKEALSANQEALEIHRVLVQSNPDQFRPYLAGSLNNLANSLLDMGKHEEALTAIRESVEIRRVLAQSNPDQFRPYIASSLNNQANILSAVGKCEEALGNVEEAVEIYRELAQSHPDAFSLILTSSLNNLANRLSEMGKLEKALGVIKEAVEFYRASAQQNPNVFKPDIACALNNQANILSKMRKFDEALKTIQEAVEIHRELARSQPEIFRPLLARSLNNRVIILFNIGKPDEAIATIKEVAEIINTTGICENVNLTNDNRSIETSKTTKKKKCRRNEPCPCESGKKYKKCCGR